MKKIIIFTIAIFNVGVKSNSQITKKNWMVGGNGRLESQKRTLNYFDAKGFNIDLSPNVGYFFIDKFAGGIRARFASNKVEYSGSVAKSTLVGIGPFLRYYLLPIDNRVNLFAESAYQYLNYSGNSGASNNANVFTFSAGPVIYFNTSVGIEFTVNYELNRNDDANTKANTFFLNIGFQIHLKKENSQ